MPVVKTVCNMCSTRCGINVQVEEGRILSVRSMEEHPVHELCLRSEANINALTDDENRDPTSAYPGFRSVLCRVSKVQQAK